MLIQLWFLWVPLALMAVETLCGSVSPSFVLFSYLSLRDQPAAFVWHLGLAFIRTFAAYVTIAGLFELAFSFTSLRQLKRAATFLLAYALGVTSLSYFLPTVAKTFVIPPALVPTVAAVLFFILKEKQRPAVRGRVLATVVVSLIAICVTQTSEWSRSAELVPAKPNQPSFLLVGFDGMPGDFFRERAGEKRVAPNFQTRWAPQSLDFENAYSVSNSTFTSWFSILSGSYPSRSNVHSLFPASREGNVDPEKLLPSELKQSGYRTVFMTDCGNTSYMKAKYGFTERYHAGAGFFDCGKGLVLSNHPLNFLFQTLGLFPELDSFCSSRYRADDFFNKVSAKLNALQADREHPFLLAVHSCVTHHLPHLHQPSRYSKLRDGLPEQELKYTAEKKSLAISIRQADHFLDRILSEKDQGDRNVWSFFFFDHGIRLGPDKNEVKHYSHGIGYPVSRFQYNVPLAILPPSSQAFRGRTEKALVSLIDIRPTIAEIRGGQKESHGDGQSLMPLLRGEVFSSQPVLLTSALPIQRSLASEGTIGSWMRLARMTKAGLLYFPKAVDQKLFNEGPRALVDLPYRLVGHADGHYELFDEMNDPDNLIDISTQKPEVRDRLLMSLRKASALTRSSPRL